MTTLRKHVETWAATGTLEGVEALAELDRLQRTESNDVLEFMKRFGHVFSTGAGQPLDEHPTLNRPRNVTVRLARERFEKMLEELKEFSGAAMNQDLAGMADALVDLVYFAKGTAVLMGLPWAELWADVHRANMEKERGAKMREGRLHKVDAVKPIGWRPPQTMAVLMSAGYVPERDVGVSWDHPEHAPGGEQAALGRVLGISTPMAFEVEGLKLEIDREDDGRFIAEVTNVPGAMAYGATREEACGAAIRIALEVRQSERKS